MCARYSLIKEEMTILIGLIAITIKVRARYNIGPGQSLPVIFANGARFESQNMIWGWKTAWSKQLLINAQAELILSKPAFKAALGQRCLIPADGFYEWTADKTPVRFTRADQEPFCFGGLWQAGEPTESRPGGSGRQFLILTTQPNSSVAPVHNRMPLIVRQQQYGDWLGGGTEFEAVLANPDRGDLAAYPVQRSLNDVRAEGAGLIKPGAMQGVLF